MVDRRGALWFNATVILLWPGDDRGVFWEEFYYERNAAGGSGRQKVEDECAGHLLRRPLRGGHRRDGADLHSDAHGQTFAITLAAVVLGSKLSTISSLIYIIMGAAGLPVLANFSGGFDKFVGPTGGFLLSFPLMAFIIGWGAEHRKDFKGAYVIALVVGTVVNYVVGVAMFVVVAHSTVSVAVSACVLPFIPTAIIKAILASVIGFAIRERVPELKK